jgi:putative endonuclease
MNKRGYVYLLANKKNGTLYLGVTSDLMKRVHEHKNKTHKGFTDRYDVTMLIWYESCESVEIAISREKNIKNWKREWKVKLIEDMNPEWVDLYDGIL